MTIISLPCLIPRFNWAMERRGFRNLLAYYGRRTARFQEQMERIGAQR